MTRRAASLPLSTVSRRGGNPYELGRKVGTETPILIQCSRGRIQGGRNNDGWTPLYRAAYSGHLEIVKLLVVEFKADVNDRDDYGMTPLHLAASNGHLEVVKLLVVEFKADVHAKDRCKKTPLHKAVTSGELGSCGRR